MKNIFKNKKITKLEEDNKILFEQNKILLEQLEKDKLAIEIVEKTTKDKIAYIKCLEKN